ncbi:MAG: hypothetical protein H7343_12200 [Undibacterium sp.]|nr:hypothetical protein [Opitutaceae bacterium]
MSPILPFQLTVAQFAAAVQRCQITIRRDIRAKKIAASKRKPYRIHPRELTAFGVDAPLAIARLTDAGLFSPPARPATPAPEPAQSAA